MSLTKNSNEAKSYINQFEGSFAVKNVGIDSVQTPSFLSKLVPTLNLMRWRFILLGFILGITGSWLIFSLIYYGVSRLDTDTFTCIENVNDFASAFCYSIEVQVTIGNYICIYVKSFLFFCEIEP